MFSRACCSSAHESLHGFALSRVRAWPQYVRLVCVMRPLSECQTFACGSAPHWAHRRYALCCRTRCCVGLRELDIAGGAPTAETGCAARMSPSCRFWTPRVIESRPRGTASPASLMRVRRAQGSSVWSLSYSAGPGFRASPKRTPAYPPGCSDLEISSCAR